MAKYYVLIDCDESRLHAKHDNLNALAYLRDIELRGRETLICLEDQVPQHWATILYIQGNFGDALRSASSPEVIDVWLRDKIDEMQPPMLRIDDVKEAAAWVAQQPEHMRFTFMNCGGGWSLAEHLDFDA